MLNYAFKSVPGQYNLSLVSYFSILLRSMCIFVSQLKQISIFFFLFPSLLFRIHQNLFLNCTFLFFVRVYVIKNKIVSIYSLN
jgi:hypothetical protein